MFRVTLDERLDESSFADLWMSAWWFLVLAEQQTYPRWAHNGDNRGRGILWQPIDERNMESLLFDLSPVLDLYSKFFP